MSQIKPTLSVTLCNYNHGHYLPEVLEAILGQSYLPKEFIIVDDGSTDNSVQIIEKFSEKHSIIKFVRNKTNLGGVISANNALRLATGDFIYSAAADDRVLPGMFEKTMAMLAKHPDTGLCCSEPVTFEGEGGKIFPNSQGITSPQKYSPSQLLEQIKKRRFRIAGHTSIVRRNSVLALGGWREDLKWHCDWFVLYTIGFQFGICYLPEQLAMFRISNSSYSGKPAKQSEREAVYEKMLSLWTELGSVQIMRYIKASAILSHFGSSSLQYFLMKPKTWNYITPLFVRNVARSMCPKWIKRAVKGLSVNNSS